MKMEISHQGVWLIFADEKEIMRLQELRNQPKKVDLSFSGKKSGIIYLETYGGNMNGRCQFASEFYRSPL